MISRVSGALLAVRDGAAEVDVGGVGYEVLLPGATARELAVRVGSSITLQTYHYFEGSVATGSLAPRLVGFLCESDRDFFHELTRVKGISFRKALRIMDLPVPQLAAAIAAGDEHLLTKLPDVGRKTAAQIVAELRDQVQPFTSGPVSEAPVLSDAQRQAVEVLVGWGDRRADAQRWVAEAVAVDGTLREPDQIVRAAYRLRARP